jgi:hypothetical protein
MKGTRKRYPASFKARVALEAAKQTKTLAERAIPEAGHSVPEAMPPRRSSAGRIL